MIQIAVIDDDRMLLDGLCAWMEQVPDIRVVLRSAHVAPVLLRHPDASVVLLDLRLQDGTGPRENVRLLVDGGYRVLIFSSHHDGRAMIDTFEAGALGYVTKDNDLEALANALREVSAGRTVFSRDLAFALSRDASAERPTLSDQESAMLVAYASGMTLEAASRSIGVRPGTGKKYLDRVKDKYQTIGRPARSKIELARRAREDGLH